MVAEDGQSVMAGKAYLCPGVGLRWELATWFVHILVDPGGEASGQRRNSNHSPGLPPSAPPTHFREPGTVPEVPQCPHTVPPDADQVFKNIKTMTGKKSGRAPLEDFSAGGAADLARQLRRCYREPLCFSLSFLITLPAKHRI